MNNPAESVRQVYDSRLLAELSKESNIPPVRPDGFGITVSEFARANSITINPARALLDAKVEAGELQKTEMRRCRGGTVSVYHK